MTALADHLQRGGDAALGEHRPHLLDLVHAAEPTPFFTFVTRRFAQEAGTISFQNLRADKDLDRKCANFDRRGLLRRGN